MDQLINFNNYPKPEKRTWLAVLLVFAGMITQSPIFLNYGPFKGNIYYILTLFIAAVLCYRRIRIKNHYIPIACLIIGLQLLGIVYWLEPKLFLFQIYFFLAWIIIFSMNQKDLDTFIKVASIFVMILVIGGMIGFIYTLAGGTKLFSIENEDTRSNGFYFTTFSNTYLGSIIRPSGIYDEPGALSFVICLVAAMRKLRGFSNGFTWGILIMGFFTLSIAHLIYVGLYLCQDMRKWNLKNISVFILAFFMIILLISQSVLWDVFSQYFFARLKFEDGQMAGDNRSALVINAVNYLNTNVFFFGLDVDCIVRPAICQQKGYNQFGDNPLGPLVWGGITLTFPYYLIVLFTLFKGIKHVNFIYIGFFLLLLQRIDVMSYGYALLIAILTYVIILKHTKKRLVQVV
jgi:hypothetical protein